MIRPSFRQSMSAGLLLILAFLGWAGAYGWYLLEDLTARSRENSELAVRVSTSIQEIRERAIDVERSARQYLVLSEAGTLQRFDSAVASTQAALARLDAVAAPALGSWPGEWQRTASDIGRSLRAAPTDAAGARLPALLARLTEVNGELARAGQRWIDARQAATVAELERGRLRFGLIVAAAVLAASAVALLMSWWLARPIGAIEQAIGQLGENRLEQPIAIQGPADLRQLGQRLDWLRRRLAELETERDRALRHVSHELKTPLTALREGVALLHEELAGPLAGAQREIVGILDTNARALQGHIESLLRLNAVSLGARRQHLHPINLRRLFDEVAQDREWQIRARQLKLQSSAPGGRGLLDGDKLRVVVDNLLSNAIDFSPDGGTIRLDGRIDGDRLCIACVDQGPGVAAEDAERIFAPFVQGLRPAPIVRQGSGVGLSIVRELMTVMGGEIRLLAAGTPGGHFEVILPWTRAD